MSQSCVVVGVDGGGTKTHCSVVDVETEKVLGTGVAGCSNQNSVGKEKAKEAVSEAIANALSTANLTHHNVVGICLGISGVDRPNDKIEVTGWIRDIFRENENLETIIGKGLLIYNDGVTAMSSGTFGNLKDCMVIISGTGSICIATEDGENFVRTGGWGPKLGDTGNAWSIGNKILCAISKAIDGIGPETQLVELVKKRAQLNDIHELIPYIYRDSQWSHVADFAPLATQCYQTDQVAKDIISSEVESLRDMAKAAAKKLGWDLNKKFTLVLCGSVLTHEGSIVAQKLIESVKNIFPNVEVTLPKCHPSLGAALLVLRRTA